MLVSIEHPIAHSRECHFGKATSDALPSCQQIQRQPLKYPHKLPPQPGIECALVGCSFMARIVRLYTFAQALILTLLLFASPAAAQTVTLNSGGLLRLNADGTTAPTRSGSSNVPDKVITYDDCALDRQYEPQALARRSGFKHGPAQRIAAM
jgi:hypothetical protein